MTVIPIEWKNQCLNVLDQRRLPHEEIWVECHALEDVEMAIRDMLLRGAPLIGIAAAFGMTISAIGHREKEGLVFQAALQRAADCLLATRPTAVNLQWAINRIKTVIAVGLKKQASTLDIIQAVEADALAIWREDADCCDRMAQYFLPLITKKTIFLTYCNAGALATGGIGTAVGVITTAFSQGRGEHVYVCETRPYLQGTRLTAYELKKAGIPYTIITDNMVAHVLQQKKVEAIVVGADRIARNGDVANKIGTRGVAIQANYHGVPFYVAAPASTFDLSCADGAKIPIENRPSQEVTEIRNIALAPSGSLALNPAFDVTPAHLITAIISDRGVIVSPGEQQIVAVISDR